MHATSIVQAPSLTLASGVSIPDSKMGLTAKHSSPQTDLKSTAPMPFASFFVNTTSPNKTSTRCGRRLGGP